MAQGYLQKFLSGKANIYSAGIETHGINPGAIKTMAYDGIDISHHTSNNVTEYTNIDFHYIITVCNHANKNLSVITSKNATRLHRNFSDPSKVVGTVEEISEAFVKTRHEIMNYCLHFVSKYLY
jgi:arsenate reductase